GANLDGIKQNIEQRKRGSFCYTLAEHQRYAVYIPLEEIDGFIFNMLPQEVVEEEISTGTKDILLTVLCVALFSGLIITYIIIRENIHRKKSEEEREMLRMSEEEYRIAAKQSGKFLARYNIMTKTLYQQESSAEIFGSGLIVENVPDSVYLTDNVSPESRDEYKSLFDQMNAGQATGSGNVCLKNKILNEYRWFQVDYTTIFTSDNVPQHSIITFYDNTKQREKELAYEHWNQTLTSIDGEKAFVFESNLTRDIFDPQARVLPGMLAELENYKSFNDRTHFFTNNFVHPDDVDACNSFLSRERLLMRFYAGSREEMMEYRVTIDGACKWYRLKVQMVQYPKSEEIKAYVIHSDINDEKLEKLAMMARSQEDSLTGLLNRATFSEKVSELLLAMPGMQHVLVMIDIDNFKRVNDTLGHIRGDKILIDIAKSLKSILREGDLVGRIGGDEFMVFLKNIPYIDVIEKRAALMCRLLEIDASESVSISGSLGISLYPRDGVNFSQLYRCADIAVYKAKGNGRNRYEFYRAGIKMEDIKLESLPLEGQDFRAELEIARKNQINDIIFQNKALCVRQDEDERFRKIMENVGIATFEWNKISETYSSSLSFDEYEISRMDIRQFFGDNPDLSSIHPDDRALFCDVTLVGIDKKQKYTEIKVRLKLVGGDYVWVRLGTVVILDGNGSLKSIIGIVIRDGIKKRKSETRLEAIIKHMDSGVVLFELSEDGSTVPIYVSERYISTADKTNVFDKDARIADFVLEEDRKKLLANIMNCAHSKELFDGVYRVVCDGKTHLRYVRATKIPYENIQNPVIAAIEINFDDE
ncbi:MAG: diguanylate cyclase, partial [Oscillospiraceae bacterium]